jgi:regulator of replication initiation timing
MKILAVGLMFFYQHALSQNLSSEDQKKLIEENKALREEIKKLKTELPQEDSVKMMEALKKGKRHQEETNRYLEELDKED